MILPILSYGQPTLRKKAEKVEVNFPDLNQLIEDMFETMYQANGIGLAAPQIDKSIRLLVIDLEVMKDDYPEAEGFKRVFINPEIIEEKGELWAYTEGCLSVPEIHEEVNRKSVIRIRFQDGNFEVHEEEFSGMCARVIQHEMDHLEGKVFVDRLSMLRKTLLKRKLQDISSGKIKTSYRMRYTHPKR